MRVVFLFLRLGLEKNCLDILFHVLLCFNNECQFFLLYLIEEFLATEIVTNTNMSVTISENCALWKNKEILLISICLSSV